MVSLLGACALSAAILLQSGVVAERPSCEEVVAAQDEALTAAEDTIAKLRAALDAARELAALEAKRADLAERQLSLMSASYERELKVVNAQLRTSKWRRILDAITVGGVGFAVGTVAGD